MILIDVHAHLDIDAFAADLPHVLERAHAAGVVAVVAQGVHHDSNERVLALAGKHPLVKAALGLYPLDAPNVAVHDGYPERPCTASVDETLAFIKANAARIVAIGEVGIDLKHSDDEKSQVENFTKVLRLAAQLKKPVIIHSRKAEKLVLDILEDAKQERVVLHCFGGGKKLVARAAALGYTLTVTSNANRLQHFQMVAKHVPLAQLLTETDAPYLAPVKDERNEPANVATAVEAIARQKGITPEEAARNVYLNYQRLFT